MLYVSSHLEENRKDKLYWTSKKDIIKKNEVPIENQKLFFINLF
jgi:hypothetical protein